MSSETEILLSKSSIHTDKQSFQALAKAAGSFGKWHQQLAAFYLLIFDEQLRAPLSVNNAREMTDLLD